MKYFRLCTTVYANGVNKVCKYVSQRTGLTVTIAEVESPLVNGYFCLATEPHDDDGLAHTLEHLVFMGSEDYPYKGILDSVANRCFADGTNAWTDVDNTCYTIKTAGSAGFLTLLPMYLDHILYPMLTESQYLTEVHHVTGEGDNAGVVYSEMKDYESRAECVVHWELVRNMFPLPSAYGCEFGGRLEALRSSCSYDKVLKFHKEFYNPKNLNLIITGMVNHETVLKTLGPFEDKLLKNETVPKSFQRPFSSEVVPITKSVEKTVICPSDDPSRGYVELGWYGPTCEKWYDVMGLHVLMDYLTDSAVSPFEKVFVQNDHAVCSNVDSTFYEQSTCMIQLSFSSTNVEKHTEIMPNVKSIFNGLLSPDSAPGCLDLDRMKSLVQRSLLRSLEELEERGHKKVADLAIGDFLYGKTEKDLENRFNEAGLYRKLKAEPKSFWLDLIRNYFVDKPYVLVIGVPTTEEQKTQLANTEKERIENQKLKLGPEGLKDCGRIIEAAIEKNEENLPDPDLIDKFAVTSLEGIHFITLKSTNNLKLESDSNPKFCLSKLPVVTFVDDGKTNYIEVTVMLDCSNLTLKQKALLPLYSRLVFESPIVKNEALIPYEDVVRGLNADVVDFESGQGICGDFKRFFTISVKTDYERHENSVKWLSDVLFGLQFDAERVQIIAQQMVGEKDQDKRDGFTMLATLSSALNYMPDSIPFLAGTLRQEVFLKQMIDDLKTNPEKILNELNGIKSNFNQLKNMMIHVLCNTNHFDNLNSFLDPLFPDDVKFQQQKPKCVPLPGKEPTFLRPVVGSSGKSAILPLSAIEPSFLMLSTPLNLSYNDREMIVLMFACQYFSQTEGILYTKIRGAGLSYDARIAYQPEKSFLYLSIGPSSNIVEAFDKVKLAVDEFLTDSDEVVDENEFEGAKSSLLFSFIDDESTVTSVSNEALLSYFRGVPPNHLKTILDQIWDLTEEDLISCVKKYFVPMLAPKSTATLAVVCHENDCDSIVAGLAKYDRQLEIVSLESPLLTSLC